MEHENQAPPGGIAAHLTIRDGRGDEAVRFYQDAFGAKEQMRHLADDGKRIMHAHLTVNGGSLMLCDPYPEHGHPHEPAKGYTLHMKIKDIDAAWTRAVDAGCEIVLPLQKMFWGERYGQLRDPFGVMWSMGYPDA